MRGQTQTAAAQGLEFRNSSVSAAATRQGSERQRVITKGRDLPLHGLRRATGKGGWKFKRPVRRNNSRLVLDVAQVDV